MPFGNAEKFSATAWQASASFLLLLLGLICVSVASSSPAVAAAAPEWGTASAAGAPASVAEAPTFTDVSAADRYSQAIEDLARRDIIAGFDDGTFRPGSPVNRQEFAKMVVLALGLPVTEADVCAFGDVESSVPPKLFPDHYVAVAAARGITKGTGPAVFAPWESITRAQVVTMVVRALAGYPGALETPSQQFENAWGEGFSDVHGPTALAAEWNHLLWGVPVRSEAADPWAPMPRGEVAQVLCNFLHLLEPQQSVYVGAGDATLDLRKHPGPATVHIEGKADTGMFRVVARGGAREVTLVDTTGPCKGILALDFSDGSQTVQLEVRADGAWTVEFLPLSSAPTIKTPAVFAGTGDRVLQVEGGPEALQITNAAGGSILAATAWSRGVPEQLVSSAGPYSGRLLLPAGAEVLEVRATGTWAVATELHAFDAAQAMIHLRRLADDIGVRQGGTPGEAAAARYVADYLISLCYAVSIRPVALPNGRVSHDVVAVKKGTSRDTIVVGAHVDTKVPSSGANDNASGSAAVLELARDLKDTAIVPTVEFVLFGTEEMIDADGDHHHYGSRAFVRGMTAQERADLVGMIAIDMVAYGESFVARTMGQGPQRMSAMLRAYAPARGVSLGYLRDTGAYGWSDHEPFERAGYPAVWIEWRDDPTYHTVDDTSAHCLPDRLAQTGDLVLGFLRSLGPGELDSLRAARR